MEQSIIFEFIGTAILVLLGDGVCANVGLKGSKAKGGGWIVVTLAWGLAVFVAAFISAPYSGAHLNPAVTVGLAVTGAFKGSIIGYIIAQIAGGFVGGCLVYLFFKPHFDQEEDPDNKLGIFCTAPAIRSFGYNFICEVIGTFLLVFGIMTVSGAEMSGPLPVALVVMAIGMSLGGTTGYAINPARDLGPRIAHAILPIKDKRDSDWAYSWIPALAPIVGAILAAGLYKLVIG